MRMTPAQLGMEGLLGERNAFATPLDWSLAQVVRYGHDFLVEIAGVDLGYDPAKWHEHLSATNAGGYRWNNKHLGFPKRIARAMSDEAWLAVVQEIVRSGSGTVRQN